MILLFINIREMLKTEQMLKTSGFAFGFQHLPQDLANVNEWKIRFDPYIIAEILVPQVINSHVSTDRNPFINKAIHVLLIHGFETVFTPVPGRHAKHVRLIMRT